MDKKIEIQGNVLMFLDTSGNDVKSYAMTASDISAIHIDNRTVSKFFGLKKIETKSILITAQGIEKRLELFEHIEGPENFAAYSDELINFAKAHHIAYRIPDSE
ncbi:MAG: hypothetical protein PHZ09_08130 [Eubacteriales bacterium]|jgi:hypothetical protein|nr:hypothetical protein [Eubacteriales bacterium]